MRITACFLLGLTGAAILPAACATDDGDGAVTPELGSGKADAIDQVDDRGALELAVATNAAFTEDLEFHGYRLAVRPGARVRVEITQAGTAKKLDTTLFVYGPSQGGAFGTESIAFDDDSGWGKQSRITGLELAQGGEYLVVVGTHDARGRGQYRLRATCENGDCAPLPVECVFGDEYRNLRWSHDVVSGDRRVLSSPAGLDALTRAQVIAAVQSTGFDEVTTVEAAFEFADEGEINRTELWDRTSARAYVVYEMGAGDTSVGAYFELAGTEVVARISDGFHEGCSAGIGNQGNDCTSDADCAAGRCFGNSEGSELGRCTVLSGFGEQTMCSAADECDIGQGLLCAGLTRTDDGICFPAWMRGNFGEGGRFDDGLALVIPDGGSVERTLLVYGLATVDMDVELAIDGSHDAPEQLTVTLTNPAGNEVEVPLSSGAGMLAVEHALSGFSGDEMVDGTWTLRVTDTAAGGTGTLDGWHLRIGSRFD